MKKILIFLMSAAVAVSCSDDIFDVDPSGKVSSETRDEVAKEDPDKVLQGIEASIYTHYATYYKNDLQWLTGFKGFELAFGMTGQDMTLLLQHSMNLYMYINDYWQEEYTPTFNVWNMFYIPIATANEILATATLDASAESETMKAYRARALTSRAFGYYHLINVYQYPYSAANKDLPGVPLATEETLGQNLPRATMEQVYKRITDDLDEALRIFEEIGYDDTGSGPISTPAWPPFCAPVSHWSWRTGGKPSRWPTIFWPNTRSSPRRTTTTASTVSRTFRV